ncbi:hypothetical protein [Kitasatospora sp. MMS16-BH015]|uniref:hypothetical protein n=1 Tax=Kitasatospora sp. MMS16-BH015 TaxID=2018025 RepID=UPI000CF2CFCE|nr:hypothetical protein [Kitasatospora sp. MMS16-BH015]
MSATTQAHRFRDPRSTKYHFLSDILVSCPRCARSARVITREQQPGDKLTSMFAARRLVCRHCGLTKDTLSRRLVFLHSTTEGGTDPYFGAPLRLQIETRHGWLWAYNLEHLSLIQGYVTATLRERAPWYDTGTKMTLVARLPLWVKQAKNRDEVLRAVNRIRALLTSV